MVVIKGMHFRDVKYQRSVLLLHVCIATNCRYLGQLESNGYCYSLFRNNPELVPKLTSDRRLAAPRCSKSQQLRHFLRSLPRRRTTFPTREFQTPTLFDSPSNEIQLENGLAIRIESRLSATKSGTGLPARLISTVYLCLAIQCN